MLKHADGPPYDGTPRSGEQLRAILTAWYMEAIITSLDHNRDLSLDLPPSDA